MREDYEKALSILSKMERWLNKNLIREAESYLDIEENVLHVELVNLNKVPGILVVTTKKVFTLSQEIHKFVIKSILLKDIRSLSKKNYPTGSIEINGVNKSIGISTIHYKRVNAVYNSIMKYGNNEVETVDPLFRKTIKIQYLGGYPKVKPGEVNITSGLESGWLNINNEVLKVTKIEWDEKGTRSAGKAAVGAIVGGVLGPAGMIAGAAVGGRSKDNSVLIMTVEDNGIEYTVYLRANQKEFQEISSFLY